MPTQTAIEAALLPPCRASTPLPRFAPLPGSKRRSLSPPSLCTVHAFASQPPTHADTALPKSHSCALKETRRPLPARLVGGGTTVTPYPRDTLVGFNGTECLSGAMPHWGLVSWRLLSPTNGVTCSHLEQQQRPTRFASAAANPRTDGGTGRLGGACVSSLDYPVCWGADLASLLHELLALWSRPTAPALRPV